MIKKNQSKKLQPHEPDQQPESEVTQSGNIMKSKYGHRPIKTEATGGKNNPAKELAGVKAAIEHMIAKQMKALEELQQSIQPAARDKGDDML